MKLLVTGGAGFIGSAVVRAAIARGLSVVNVDALAYSGNPANVAAVADHPAYAFEQADIRDAQAMAAIFQRHRPEAVLHLAAESHVDRSIDGPLAFVETNVVGTAVLLEAARAHFDGLSGSAKARFRFHHVSTDEVFGALGAQGRFDESARYDPSSPYSASKAASDHLVRAWRRTFGLPVIVSNCGNNYGPRQFPEKFAPVVVLSALEGRPIPLYGAGENVRDWIFVEDHAEGLLAILERGRVGETYAVSGERELSNRDFAERLCATLDRIRPRAGGPHAALIACVADRPGHDFRYALDAGKLRRELGWRPRTSLDEGVERTVRWYVDNPAWWTGVRERSQRLGLARAAA